MLTKSPKRVCFSLQVKPGRIAEYKARHAAVWPEMLNALTQAGWHNYSLFLREDGLLVGYMETPDLTRALRQMASSEINAKWQAEMAGFFDSPSGFQGGRTDSADGAGLPPALGSWQNRLWNYRRGQFNGGRPNPFPCKRCWQRLGDEKDSSFVLVVPLCETLTASRC